MAKDRPIGRRTKLTPELQTTIIEGLRLGNYAIVAAQFAGISESCYYKWIRRGEDDMAAGEDTKFSQFVQSIKHAEAEAETRAVAQVMQAGQDSWQASMTYLERKFPGRWSRGERVEHTGTVKVAAINLAALSDAELEEAIRLAAKVQGEPVPEEIKE